MTEPIETRALYWFLHGEPVDSAMAIAEHMLFATRKHQYQPEDSFDLGCCIALLDAIPEWRPRMGEMASVSRYWAAILPHWGELEIEYSIRGSSAVNMLRKLLDDEANRAYAEHKAMQGVDHD